MRFLLLIPVFVLFLSSVPFIQVMPVEVKVVLAEKQEEKNCCKKKKQAVSEPPSCHKAEHATSKPMACHPGTMPVEGSCQPSGANCICVCLFQFTAPENDFKAFQLDPANPLAGRTGYLEQEWKDPHIDSPGQPPDYL